MGRLKAKTYWVYILRCDNNSYYAGYTTDLIRRYQEHLTGTAKCKYTRSFKPINIAQCWQVHGEKSVAMAIERYIKKSSKVEKTRLIESPGILAQLFGPNVSIGALNNAAINVSFPLDKLQNKNENRLTLHANSND